MEEAGAGGASRIKADGPVSTGLLLTMLFAISVVTFLDRQILNILAEPIRIDMGLSDSQIGLLSGPVFVIFYALAGFPLARLLDRPSTDRITVMSVCIVAWSLCTAASGLAQSFTHLLLARLGVGVGEAGSAPTAHALIGELVPPERRATAIAVFGMGVPAGTLVGLAFGGLAADWFGWRGSFIALGLPGVLLALMARLVLRDRRAEIPAGVPAAQGGWASLKEILSSRAYVMVLSGLAISTIVIYGQGLWSAVYMLRIHGLAPGQAGLWLGLSTGSAGMLGTWLGGRLSDHFSVKVAGRGLFVPAIGIIVALPLQVASFAVQDWRLCLLLLWAPSAVLGMSYGPAFGAMQALARPSARALASAVGVVVVSLVGLGLGPSLYGWASQVLSAHFGPLGLRYTLMGGVFILTPSAILFWRGGLQLSRELAEPFSKTRVEREN